MDHYLKIYNQQAQAYQRMIAAEDVHNNLTRSLEALTTFQGKRLLDLGSGTGRIPALFHRAAVEVVALDLHRPMLAQNQVVRDQMEGRWCIVQGDMRSLPIPSGWAEITTAGWAIGHLRAWFSADWPQQIGLVLREMHRVTAPGGPMIILETLGTGFLKPEPPSAELAEFYTWLETEWAFSRQIVQTDYQFESVEDAVRRTEFFFGEELAAQIRKNRWARLPEWTGIWVKQN